MATDLSDLIDSLKREVNPPGSNLYPDANDDTWLGNLQDAFWEAYLDGLITSTYAESDGLVTPDLPKDLQQLLVFYAGYKIIRNTIRDLKTMFRSKAGPVEYEVQQSSSVFRDILAELSKKRSLLLQRLSDLGYADSYYVDAVIARTDSARNYEMYLGY